MTGHERRKRLVDAWVESYDAQEPLIDRERGRKRVLEAQRTIVAQKKRMVWVRAAIAAAAAMALVAGAAKFWPTTTTFTVAGQRGEVGEWLATAASEELVLDFSEGTHVELEGGSRGRVEHVTGRGARVEIERGSLHARVVHREGAAWGFGAGPFEVTVTGTSLSVNWRPDGGQFELAVQRGAVVVRGPYIDKPLEVRAGERCRVDLNKKTVEVEQVATSAAPTEAAPPKAPPAPAAEPEPALGPSASTRGSSPWLDLKRKGNYDEAIAAAERIGLSKIYKSAPPDDLLELAHSAGLAGRPDIERGALMACRSRCGGEPAARAAYLLGRSAPPAEAARWFETYLEEQPKGLLAPTAAGRLIESYQRAGDVSGARRAATRYLASYPDGPQAALARQVLGR